MYIKAAQATFESKDRVLETQEYLAINNKALSIKSWAREIRFPTDKAYKVKNRVDKDKALGAKKPTVSKGVVKKYPFGFNPSGCLQGKGFKIKKKALTLYY